MTEEKGSARPRQVTMAVVMAVVSSLVLILSLFETLERLRTPATRESVDDFLTGSPGSSLSLDTAQVVELMRALAFLSGALAAAALVFAVFVWQRHRGARVGLTVAAVLLLLTVPVAGLMPAFVAVSAFLLWSQPARDWYAGRVAAPAAGRTAPAPTPVDREPTPPQQPSEAPAQSSAQPPPPPYAQPYGQPGPAGQPYGEPGTSAQQWQHGPPGSHLLPREASDKRPTAVTVAAVLTWVAAGLTALAMAAFLVILGVDRDAFVDEFDRAARQSELTLTRDQIWAFGLAIGLTMLVWSLIAVVLGIFMFRRSNAARYALAVSAVMAALFSLLSIMSLISAVTLLMAVTTVILLFTSSSNRWFARRSAPGGQPPSPPYPQPTQGPADHRSSDAPGRNQPW